jgi:GNAT superfamily N-acetyltransferase
MTVLQKLKQGYARLLDVPVECFEKPDFILVETTIRESAEWANWVMPVWLLSIESSIVCSVSPKYARLVQTLFGSMVIETLINPELWEKAHCLIDAEGWRQREIFFYPNSQPPPLTTPYQVEKLKLGDKVAEPFLRAFDGGVYAIRDQAGQIASHAGIKNKGLINEIAVGTEPEYQKKGMGKAVVTHAVTGILARGTVPALIPDTVTNVASYALAHSFGFQKVGEMLFWEYELLKWKGFPLNG